MRTTGHLKEGRIQHKSIEKSKVKPEHQRESHGFNVTQPSGISSDKIMNITQFVLLAISLCYLEIFL